MITYKIIPNSINTGGNILETHSDIPLKECRKLCDSNGDCDFFIRNETKRECIMGKGNTSTRYSPGNIVYAKKGNSHPILFFVFIGICSIIIFCFLCNKNK